MNNFRELKVWQKAITLVKKIYLSKKSFPSEEQFGLTNQMRRCAVSIPSNIAEGAGRKSEKEFEHFLFVSLGSCFEIEKMIRGLQKTIS